MRSSFQVQKLSPFETLCIKVTLVISDFDKGCKIKCKKLSDKDSFSLENE